MKRGPNLVTVTEILVSMIMQFSVVDGAWVRMLRASGERGVLHQRLTGLNCSLCRKAGGKSHGSSNLKGMFSFRRLAPVEGKNARIVTHHKFAYT